MNSYGKTWHTWHTWHTGRHDGQPGMNLPMGDPKLMWSFNREGECEESLKADRDRNMDIDVTKKHDQRHAFLDLAHPSAESTR